MKVLIATSRGPADFEEFDNFCQELRSGLAEEGFEVFGIIWDHGFGCTNLALDIRGSDEKVEEVANSLTLALQPAKWSLCADEIPEGDECKLFDRERRLA